MTTKVNLEAAWLRDFGKRFKQLSKADVQRLFNHYLIDGLLELRADGRVLLKAAKAHGYAQ